MAKQQKQIGSARPVPGGRAGMWELRVGGGPDPARPGKYITHRKPVGPYPVPAGWKVGDKLPRAVAMELVTYVADIEAGRIKKSTMTFGDLLDRYLDTLARQGTASSTLRTYRGYIRRWLRGDDLCGLPLDKVTAEHLDLIYEDMADAGRKPSTINQVHAIVRKAFNVAIKKGWIDTNPAVNTTSRPTVRPGRKTPAEVRSLLRTVKAANEEDAAIAVFILLAAGTGARRGEVCGLRDSGIDWDAERVHIEWSVGRDDDGSRIDQPDYVKTYGGIDTEVKVPKDFQDRWVDVPPTVMVALKVLNTRNIERAEWAETTRPADAFFFSDEADGSKPWKPDFATAAFSRARERAGVKALKLKDVRHLLGSTLAHKGVDVAVIQAILGHGRKSTTHDWYIDAIPGSGREAAGTLSDALDFETFLTAMGIESEEAVEEPAEEPSDGPEAGEVA
jgi:integrase